MSVQQITSPPQAEAEVAVNENFAALGQAFIWSHDVTADTGLTVGLNGGDFDGNAVADSTVACTNNATNYIVVNRSTRAASVATSTTNWNNTSTYGRVARAVFASGVLTAYHDERSSAGGIFDHAAAGGAVVADGDKGDITVSSSGATWTIDNDAVTYAKMQNVSATDKLLGRSTAGAGDVEEITCTPFARSILDDADAASVRATIGAGTGTGSGDASTNTSTSVDSEIALFSGTGGKTLKRATTTGLLKAASGVLSAASAGSDYYAPGGTDVAVADGGTGASTAAAARANLGVGQAVLAIACSDETTALTTGTNKAKFINPYGTAFNVAAVVASLSTAQASGSIFTVDINEAGTSILSTKLTIDNTETNSSTAATPAVISDASIAAYAEIEVDIDQIGDGTAKGLKVYLIGFPS